MPLRPAADGARARSVTELADRWRSVVGERMAGRVDVDGASALVGRIAARTACVSGDPGWLEVAFDADAVDVDVRVAGLDLDPGWIPWLGCVVRFRYD